MNSTDSNTDSLSDRIFPVAIGFSYIYLVMTCYYVLKPVRESFFLSEKGYGQLPIAHLLVLVATFIAVLIYTKATRKLGPARLVTATNIFFLACIVAFWIFLTQVDTSGRWLNWLRGKMAWVYFCWVSVFSVFAMTLFWSVIHTVFTSESGSKCYGIIGSGATLGALTGGFLTSRFAESVGTNNLLVIAAVLLAPCLVLGSILARLSKANSTSQKNVETTEAPATKTPTKTTTPKSAIAIFRGSPYLCALGLIVMLTVVITVLDEYRYNKLIDASFTERDEKTAFFGNVYFFSNCIGLFFSLVLTGIVQTICGPRPGMLMFAGLVIVSAIAFLRFPGIHTAFYSMIALQSVGYSIYQWSRECSTRGRPPSKNLSPKDSSIRLCSALALGLRRWR